MFCKALSLIFAVENGIFFMLWFVLFTGHRSQVTYFWELAHKYFWQLQQQGLEEDQQHKAKLFYLIKRDAKSFANSLIRDL